MSVDTFWILLLCGGVFFKKRFLKFKYFWYKCKCLVFGERILIYVLIIEPLAK
jgi:hypothetical protein